MFKEKTVDFFTSYDVPAFHSSISHWKKVKKMLVAENWNRTR